MTENTIGPTEETLQLLVRYKIATIKDGKYVYAPEFESTVKKLTQSGISKLKAAKLGRKAARYVEPIILTHPTLFKNRRNLENLIGSYTCMELHSEHWKIKYNKRKKQSMAYAIWYLNDHEPEVDTEE